MTKKTNKVVKNENVKKEDKKITRWTKKEVDDINDMLASGNFPPRPRKTK